MWGYSLPALPCRGPLVISVLDLLLFAPMGTCENYIVGPGDTLSINVYEHPDLTTTVQVDGGGAIRFPLIGEFEVTGMDVSELSQAIEKKLADGYIVNPQVAIVVKEYRSRKATILGQVNAPALYELRGRTTLLELISTAGGLTADAGKYAYLTRTLSENGERDAPRQEVIKIDIKKLVEEGDTTQNILISNGDSVFISRMEKIYVTGEVKYAGAYPYEEGLTVIKAITNARGFTDRASATNIQIIRKENGIEQVLSKVKMDERVMPEDVIVVPESFF
ncbi:SLBB domain-containing protein [Desulfosudis oleivorans]|uniref:Polysaccharide export protein n=1 Tax=Desulfosudis oleivorans (strain DSM 6200 / JCM 39069 / Hxd3) TaxID=96561 RepID=A9A0G2_DESOH|nr:SLBB domain-containing protein [Desulfosudis oleivorans]ABW67462.1 polysaccharide export protein [Desulfosudis oleivorans Hxd3]